jgi:hypothetical protein
MLVPLLDHFHSPLREERHWEGFYSRWANAIVDALNDYLLPPGYYAEAHIHLGSNVEIDGAAFQQLSQPNPTNGPKGNHFSSPALRFSTRRPTGPYAAASWSKRTPGLLPWRSAKRFRPRRSH